MQAYCMKCRAKREMKDTKSIIMKNGKPATPPFVPKITPASFHPLLV